MEEETLSLLIVFGKVRGAQSAGAAKEVEEGLVEFGAG